MLDKTCQTRIYNASIVPNGMFTAASTDVTPCICKHAAGKTFADTATTAEGRVYKPAGHAPRLGNEFNATTSTKHLGNWQAGNDVKSL